MALFGTKKTNDDDQKTAKSPVKKEAATKKDAPAVSMQELYNAPAAKSVKGSAAKLKKVADHDLSNRVLIKPLITEKATNLGAENKYVFIVARSANKISIAKAVVAAYGVKPLAVNVVNMKGKQVSRGRIKGSRSDWRKAIVTLAAGETIKIYEGV